jgi:hypothetical protein
MRGQCNVGGRYLRLSVSLSPLTGQGQEPAPGFSKHGNKYKTVNKRGAAVRRGRLMDRIFGIAFMLVLRGVMSGSVP